MLSGAVLLCVLVASAAACGTDKAPSGKATSTTSSSPVDPSASSERAAIASDDLGDPWRVHTAAVGTKSPDADACAQLLGGYAKLVDGGRYEGAIFQRGDATLFARTTATTFEDDAGAIAFVHLLETTEYQECQVNRRSAAAAAGPGAAEGSSYRITHRGSAGGTGEDGFELQTDFQYQALVDGVLTDANGMLRDIVLRNGPTVVILFIEGVASEGSPPDLFATATEEATKAAQRGLKRLT
jgi:hypothetical protein